MAKLLEGLDHRSEFDETMRNISGILQDKFPDIKIDIPGLDPGLPSTGANFFLFMCSLIVGMVWITYITFFNSRVVGKILTKIANRFVGEGYVKIGSLSWSVLPGKIMFRDVAYITKDYTVRVQDGFIIFRWWLSYVPKNVSEDLSHSDTRVSIQLYGFETHVYNRTNVYRDLEKKFGFEPRFFSGNSSGASDRNQDESASLKSNADSENSDQTSKSSYFLGKNWRDLIPVIKVDMNTSKIVFGNKFLQTSLVVSMDECHSTYSTKPAGCTLDHFMHFVKSKVENLKVLLAPSPKYTGLTDEAPRYMGEGFVVVSSSEVNLYYYMDEAGLVPSEDAAVGDDNPDPEWGIDIKCSKGTNLCYGPWADRQRELIYKFFFPQDYQPMEVTPKPKPGQRRTAKLFRLRLSTEHESTMDLLFSKVKETNAVHVNIGQGTNFELKVPWIITEDGFTLSVNGTLMMVEATTSLPYRDFLQTETLQFKVEMNYPTMWNATQEWLFSFTGSKTSLKFIFAHKWFFQDMLDDWSSKTSSDLIYFVPYNWKFQLSLKEYELLVPSNEYNWIDTSSTNQENSFMGVCGEFLNVAFDLPFTDFLPRYIPFNFDITGENVDLVLFLPETNTSHDILHSLDMNAKIVTSEGKWRWKRDGKENIWRRICKYEDGWIDCWTAPHVALQIEFLYHPIPLPGPCPQAHLTTPEKEKQLLTPLRAPSIGKKASLSPSKLADFDPNSLEADKCSVKLFLGKSTAYLFGTLVKSFMHLKENVFGEDQSFTPFDSESNFLSATVDRGYDKCSTGSDSVIDPRQYRPIEVILDITVNNLQAHLLKNCSVNDDPCPFLMVEQLAFEMVKKYRETRLQLLLSPVVLRSGSLTSKSVLDDLKQGHVLLSGFQFRGQGLFSELGRPLGCDTLEYAWLIEIQCGSIIGKMSPPQLLNVAMCIETLIYLMLDKENVLKHPRPFKICQHYVNQKDCTKGTGGKRNSLCHTEADLKYRIARFLCDSIDFYIVERSPSALRIQACPIRFSTCNLHGLQTRQGMTALVKQVLVQQYISSNFPLSRGDAEPSHHQDIWIETGSLKFGPIVFEGGMSGGQSSSPGELQKIQHDFLQKHDNRARALWFLWPQALTKIPNDRVGKCGCVGGCNFFGSNRNGCNFFEPEKTDIPHRRSVAIPNIGKCRVEDPGFGQSILHDNQLVIEGFTAFGLNLENLLPAGWPLACHEPQELPFCPDYKTHKSTSSHNSSDTPKHPKYHRSFSTKQGPPLVGHPKRKRSVSTTSDHNSQKSQLFSTLGRKSNSSVEQKMQKTVSLAEVQPASSPNISSAKAAPFSSNSIGRTESLVSDVLSFYSLDGETSESSFDERKDAAKSPSASSPSSQFETASSNDINSPIDSDSAPFESPSERDSSSRTSQFFTARTDVSSISSPSSKFETASDRSDVSMDTPTLQAHSPSNETMADDGSDTLSRGDSSGSFVSALSDQKDDFGLINLHTQVNRPITDSPLLMSSYISHLTQVRCSYWNESVPVLPNESQLNGRITPQIDMIENGFNVMRMSERFEDSAEKEDENEFTFEQPGEFSSSPEIVGSDFMSSLSDPSTSKTTLLVRFQGSIDIICCPIMLQSFEKSLRSLVSTFETLHPMDVVNHLHARSADRVESKNTLKKEKGLDLQEKLIVEPKENKGKGSKNKKESGNSVPPDMFRTFEKSISSFVQASLSLPKINFMVLQASVVEEVCSFSALDRIRDITCVSLLALGIKETNVQFCKTSQSKKTVQIYIPQRNVSGKKKKSKYKIATDLRQNEPFTFESSETQREEILVTGSVKKMHSQLRRLRNDSSILKNASITAIPSNHSKVFFEYVNVPCLSMTGSTTPTNAFGFQRDSEQKMGYNMCECGFEGITLKFAKKSCNNENSGVSSPRAKTKMHFEDEVGEKRNDESEQFNECASDTFEDEDGADGTLSHQGKTSTASGSAELKMLWFNFAAPPKTPISKKIDFTKLDWNLLSTASPSFDAWLAPIDRLQQEFSSSMSSFHSRVGAVMASLMADALDVAPENFLKLSKYDKLTALSKTLRDDPSCQICSILLKFMIRTGLADVESNLDPKSVPPLNTLRQGIVVLSRQWKNALYTPILIEYNLRCRSLKNIYGAQMNLEPVREERYEESSEEEEGEDEEEDYEFDEGTFLLKSSASVPKYHLKSGSIISDFSSNLRAKLSPAHFSPLSDDILLLERTGPKMLENRASVGSADSMDYLTSVPSEVVMSGGEDTPREKTETLYDWMKRQQQEQIQNHQSSSQMQPEVSLDNVTIRVQDDKEIEKTRGEVEGTPQTKSMHLLDAHIIFEPLLSSLGVMPQQIQNLSLKNLGYNLSFLGGVDELKIDIIESEFGKRPKSSSRVSGDNLRGEVSLSSAFHCKRVQLQVDLKKLTDIGVSDGDRDKVPLYMSRAQLKRHTSTLVNFSIDIEFIAQRVNMPLLRLVNQIVTMHQNVKETNEELREMKPDDQLQRKEYMRHKKSSSGSSSSSTNSSMPQQQSQEQTQSVNSSGYSVESSHRNLYQTPSPSMTLRSQIKTRPKSFAQKFRPNSRLGGYSSLDSPMKEQHDSFILTSAPLEMITEEQIIIPCWKTMYNLLELYSTMPTTKTVQRQSLTPICNSSSMDTWQRTPVLKGSTSAGGGGKDARTPDVEQPPKPQASTPGEVPKRAKEVSFAKADGARHEHTPVIVFGIVKISKTKLSATLSGLKLNGEIEGLQTSMQYREKIRAPMKGVVDASVIGRMAKTNLVLLEGREPAQQIVVKVTIGKTQAIHTSHVWKTKDKNCGTFNVDYIQIEIPQHPVDLHGIVTRGTKEISSTLQELIGKRLLLQKTKTLNPTEEQEWPGSQQSPKTAPKRQEKGEETIEKNKESEDKSNLIKPFVMQFQIIIQKLAISAALLPSLEAEYIMENVSSRGVTGGKAKFVIDLPKHSLSFNTKLQELDQSEAKLPSEAHVDLPKVQVSAEYVQDEGKGFSDADGSIYSRGSYLKAEAEIGELEHSLTTDLLNHMVFVQKVFMREVNDVVQKMSGSDRPVPVWTEFGEFELRSGEGSREAPKQLLFSISVRLRNITITATTPANTGVRFETGNSELQISNRVQNIQGSSKEKYKIFTKAYVHIRLSLGQLIRDPIYFEAEPQFQQQAYFKTTIHLRNAFQEEIDNSKDNEKNESDVIYITLTRPLVFVHPIAVDKAILFWLSYKTAWEYWTEQRLNLNKEVLTATEQVLERVPLSQITSQLSAQHIGTLFLQLNVQDIGLCIPFSLDPAHPSAKLDVDTLGAIVATVESSSLSSCSARSTVSKGKFKDLCVRFTDDFNHFLDDWKPDKTDASLMNFCVVSEGSYEICSQTTKATKEDNAKWLLNIQWQMTGVDFHVDTNIGKHMSALTKTLTSISGIEEDAATDTNSVSEDDDFELSSSDDLSYLKKSKQLDLDLPSFLFDTTLDKSVIAKYLEHEINEQAKVVEDLQKLGAKESTISSEMKKLDELQNIASKNFRQDLVERLRRQKTKASYFKEKFGLGTGGGTSERGNVHHKLSSKSKSMYIPSPTLEEAEATVSQKDMLKKIKLRNFSLDRSSAKKEKEAISRESTISEEMEVSGEESSSDDNDIKSRPYENQPSRASKTSSLSPKSGSLPLNASAPGGATAEANVDFEVHVKIFVNSGKCVLHTFKEEEKRFAMRKDKSHSGNLAESPNPIRRTATARNELKSSGPSSARLRDVRQQGTGTHETTTFFIPGLDVRVVYLSKTDDNPSTSSNESGSYRDSMKRMVSSKKATLTAWMTLQSIPEETIITPTILEFLEQTLQPLPTFSQGNRYSFSDPDDEEDNKSSDPESNSGSQAGWQVSQAQFPVDVIVYFHMQSSTFRFSCLPVSRVECMLGLPSLDLVFSSKRVDGDVQDEFKDKIGQDEGFPDFERTKVDDSISIGGLSVTGCLNDFSLYMFHPYGGGRRKKPEEMNFSPLTSEERKDSLSVNVAFVKFHVSRSRKLNINPINLEGSQKMNSFSRFIDSKGSPESMACVRFCTIVDIGSASFKYDMRRLNEILAFPKAWYRRTLVRRLFLGELKTTSFHSESQQDYQNLSSVFGQNSSQQPTNVMSSKHVSGRRGSLVQNREGKRASISQGASDQKKIWIGQTTAHSWETVVVTNIKFNELNVHMNMGNVMGNIDWISKNFESLARLSIASTGHKNLFLSLGLNESHFEAKSGIIGGAINLGKIHTFCQLKEDSGTEPFHKIGLRLDAVEVRCDYMSTSVLMARISSLCATLKDDWHVTDIVNQDVRSSFSVDSLKPAQIFVQGDLTWDQLQVMISKSTTADILKILNKLEEFFSQQFKSSKKLFSTLEPGTWAPANKVRRRQEEDYHLHHANAGSNVKHHRHWQSALRKISGMKIYTLPMRLPEVGSVLGGVLELRGQHISLACFHGINFKSKSWALFSLKEPSISFVSDAQDMPTDFELQQEDNSDESSKMKKRTNIIQTLSFSLGESNQPKRSSHGYMATVKKISRSVSYLPPLKNVSEWFNYAFKSSTLDEVSRFPTLGSSPSDRDARSDNIQQKTEEIFALPCLTMDLKTIHEQGHIAPRTDDHKPIVDCSFITDFDNHIYVTTDAEAFFFLHDLITSYVKEKERVLSIQLSSDKLKPSSSSGNGGLQTVSTPGKDKGPIDPLQNDWRQFQCNTWHLEPTVRLISWAGSEIEPYGVDYILQRLGFSHARITIPKWLQRGCMDPLDKVLSVIVLKSIQLVQEEKDENAQDIRKDF